MIGIGFNRGTQCDSASFAIFGNDEIDSVTINIDGKKISSPPLEVSYVDDGVAVAVFPLSSSELRELKNGSSLLVETDEGTLATSLSGSAYSMNMAYGNCMKGGGSTSISSGTLQPSRRATKVPTYNQQEIARQHRDDSARAQAKDFENRCKARREAARIQRNNMAQAAHAAAAASSQSPFGTVRQAAGNAAGWAALSKQRQLDYANEIATGCSRY